MAHARFKTALGLVALIGLGYVTYDYVAALMNPTYGISGTVYLAGKPLPKGIVRFISLDPDKPRFCGAYVHDGRYDLPKEFGLAPARYQVEFSSISPEDVQRLLAAGKPVDVEEKIPFRYTVNSEVEIDLTSGAVLHADFDLK